MRKTKRPKTGAEGTGNNFISFKFQEREGKSSAEGAGRKILRVWGELKSRKSGSGGHLYWSSKGA